jgi:hypothetical protein
MYREVCLAIDAQALDTRRLRVVGDSKRVSRLLAVLGAAMVACPAIALASPSAPWPRLRGRGEKPRRLAAGSDGTVYVATLGNGIAVATAP